MHFSGLIPYNLKDVANPSQNLKTLSAGCNDFMRIFFDGKLVYEDDNYGTASNEWRSPMKLEIPSETDIIGISCQNNGLGPNKGIIASTSDGKVTNKQWLCTSKQSNDGVNPSSSAKFYTSRDAPMPMTSTMNGT